MKPLNRAERKNSIFYFLIFFVLTVALIVTAVFFGMEVPFKQNEMLKGQLAVYQKQNLFMDHFTGKMVDTQNLLDSVNRPGVQAELIDGQIADNLTQMNSMVAADSTIPKVIYTGIIGNFANLKDAKQQLRSAGGNDATIATLRQQLADYQNKLQQANLTIATLGQAVH